ncbi:MAG: hypothetical protein Kow0099_13450 [Candidatus Abyssubacteria bacterium]
MLLGILADSHGCLEKLTGAVETLRNHGAALLVHAGDMVDTLRPETVDDCIQVLVKNKIAGVMGNHEYSFVMHHFKRYPEKFSQMSKEYVSALPQQLEILDICFTHFSPAGGIHGMFAYTDTGSYEEVIKASRWPVLINGHSHEPRVYHALDGVCVDVPFGPARTVELGHAGRYVLTCGAVEDSYCAIYDPVSRHFKVLLLDT